MVLDGLEHAGLHQLGIHVAERLGALIHAEQLPASADASRLSSKASSCWRPTNAVVRPESP